MVHSPVHGKIGTGLSIISQTRSNTIDAKHFVRNIFRCCNRQGLNSMKNICADYSTPTGSVGGALVPRVPVVPLGLPAPVAILVLSLRDKLFGL
jgi:chorismate synthase